MKKYLMSLLALALFVGTAQAYPVSEGQAKRVGQQFVQANFEQLRQSANLTLVYTGVSTRGEACFYVFNVGDEGFVIVSADDAYRPIVGYSDEGSFDARNINPGLDYMLGQLVSARSGKKTGQAAPMVAAEWDLVMNSGRQMSFNGGRADTHLIQTKWDQGSPYNYYCPAGAGGPGGRTYAGCVATAMSQVMRFWNHPAKGTGSYSYYCPGYGQQSADFGNTNYDWDNMPLSISNNSPQEQIEAIAKLMYHCGVSVDMMYAIDGSGSYSHLVPNSISRYFSYSNQAVLRSRSDYSYDDWSSMMKESFDMGWPLYYSGQSSEGGHAFVCDGYNDANLFYYNWGWSGSGDGWFDFDLIDYNTSDGAIFNFVPSEVYNNTPQAPTNFTVTPAANNELAATVSWVNPSKTLNNANLTSIDQIVVTRDGEIVYIENNVTPGATMTIVDNSVPRFDAFNYTVYAISQGAHGKIAYKKRINFGPTCSWSITVTQAAFQGLRGGAIHVYNGTGTEIAQITTTNSSPATFSIDMPVGHVSFGWSAPTQTVNTMAFNIKNSQNVSVYSYSGSSDNLDEGIFFETNNNCGESVGNGAPSNLVALVDNDNPNTIHLSWDGVRDENGYGYTIYRNGTLYRLIPEGTSFVDENVDLGGYCYYVGYMYLGGENGNYTNESCASAGACYAPTDIDFEYTGNNYKIKLKWNKPNPLDGLSGYYLYRKFGEDGTYERVKLIGSNATSYTDNSANQEGDYYYKLYAYYGGLDCISAPAYWINDHNQFYLHAPYYSDGVEELEASSVAVFPNPTTGRFTIEAAGLKHLTVFNTMGQKVHEMHCQGESVDIDLNVETGIYMVRVATDNGEVTKRITVIR